MQTTFGGPDAAFAGEVPGRSTSTLVAFRAECVPSQVSKAGPWGPNPIIFGWSDLRHAPPVH